MNSQKTLVNASTFEKYKKPIPQRGCSTIVAQTAPRNDSKAGPGVVCHPETGSLAEGSRG